MSKKNNIFVDQRTVAHAGSEGRVDAWQMYRQMNTVTQRLNVSVVADAVQTSETVFFNGHPAITVASNIQRSSGDADTNGGLLNGGLTGQATFFRTGSSSVLVDGQELVRQFDLCEPNRGNGPLIPLMQMGDAPSTEALPDISLKERLLSKESEVQAFKATWEGLQTDNHYGHLDAHVSAPDGENVSLGRIPLMQRMVGSEMTVSCAVNTEEPEAEAEPTLVQLWLLEKDGVAGYTKKDIEVMSELKTEWASVYPIPLGTVMSQPAKTFSSEGAVESIRMVSMCPVIPNTEPNSQEPWALLPNGWLYVFVEGHLWRELQVTSLDSCGLATYHFSDVNLITEQNRDRREATTQGRMEVLLLPIRREGHSLQIGLAFSAQQWPWQTVVDHGGLNDERVMPHRSRILSCKQGDQKRDLKTFNQLQFCSESEVLTAVLHADPCSPYAEYRGHILPIEWVPVGNEIGEVSEEKPPNLIGKVYNHIDQVLKESHKMVDQAAEGREAVYQKHPELRQYERDYQVGTEHFKMSVPASAKELLTDLAIVGASSAAGPLLKRGKFLSSKNMRVTESHVMSDTKTFGNNFPNRDLPRCPKSAEPVPDAEFLNTWHSQLGTKVSNSKKIKGQIYPKAREFGPNNKAIREIDGTNHGRPDHPKPHQHRYISNQTGGTLKRGPTEPLDSSCENISESIKKLIKKDK